MQTHELKTWSIPFHSVIIGDKKYEIRSNDRDFRVGDTLLLREWEPDFGYSGESVSVVVTYLTKGGEWGIPDGLCVMSIELFSG